MTSPHALKTIRIINRQISVHKNWLEARFKLPKDSIPHEWIDAEKFQELIQKPIFSRCFSIAAVEELNKLLAPKCTHVVGYKV